jgi:ankyrin repeat protein
MSSSLSNDAISKLVDELSPGARMALLDMMKSHKKGDGHSCPDPSSCTREQLSKLYVAKTPTFPLYDMCRSEYDPPIEVLEFLLSKYPEQLEMKKGRSGRTPLHAAVRHDKAEVVAALLNAGAKLDATDVVGQNVLHLLAQKRIVNAKVLRTILAHAAKDAPLVHRARLIDIATPLQLAVAEGEEKLPMARLLLDLGADPGAIDGTGGNAVHLCASKSTGLPTLVRLLQCNPLDLNVQRHNSAATPLHVAIRYEQWTAASLLMQHGARWDLPLTKTGSTAKDMLKAAGKLDLLSYATYIPPSSV